MNPSTKPLTGRPSSTAAITSQTFMFSRSSRVARFSTLRPLAQQSGHNQLSQKRYPFRCWKAMPLRQRVYAILDVPPALRSYLAVKLTASDAHFPIHLEREMWRAASVCMSGSFILGGAIEVFFACLWITQDCWRCCNSCVECTCSSRT